jgi:hypothetical protein
VSKNEMKRRLKSFGLVTLAWIVGLLFASIGGLILAMLIAGPAATIAAPLVLGLVVGAAQRRVLHVDVLHAKRSFVLRSFVLLSALGSLVGWLFGTFVAFRLSMAGLAVVAPWIEGAIVGLAVGSAQAFAIKTPLPSRSRWTIANAIVWSMALGPLLSPSVPPVLRLFSLLVPGVFALTLASVPGSQRQRSPLLVSA